MSQLPSTPAALVRVDSRLQSLSLKSELGALDADDLALIGKVCSHGTTRQRLRRFGGLVALGIGAVALVYLRSCPSTWCAITAANAVIEREHLLEFDRSRPSRGARAPRANNASPSSATASVATCSSSSTVRGCAAAARR